MSISKGNMKLGKVANISLPPVISCKPRPECAKDCYALKAYKAYKGARDSWDSNWDLWNNDPVAYEVMLIEFLATYRGTMFRYHVSGDIPSTEYFEMMVRIALNFPHVKFLVFTKRYEFVNDFETIPGNLRVIFSAWPGLEMDNPHNYPVAYMQDGTESRVTRYAKNCPGDCETCGICFDLKKRQSVVFIKH